MLDYLQPRKHIKELTAERFRDKMIELLCAPAGTTDYFVAVTGAGKSQAIKSFVEAESKGLRLAIVLNSKDSVEELAKDLSKTLKGSVGHWLFTTSGDYEKADLEDYQIAIVTHQFFTAQNRKYLRQRDIIIVDEAPIWKKYAEFKSRDFDNAREEVRLEKETLYPVTDQIKWLSDIVPAQQYSSFVESLYPEFVSALDLVASNTNNRGVSEVLCAVQEKRAILYKDEYRNGLNVPVSIIYPHNNPLKGDRVMIVSATAHLEGGQLQKDPPSPIIKGDFRNLQLNKIEWPINSKQIARITEDEIREVFDLVNQIMLQCTGDVLLVGFARWNDTFKRELKKISESFDGDKYIVGGNEIHLTHHGKDVGTNKYQNCKNVIYIGLHHLPRSTLMAEYFYLTEKKVSDETLKTANASGVPKLKKGKLEAEMVQMLARGSCREFEDESNVAKGMTGWLIVPSEQLVGVNFDYLFPNCNVKNATNNFDYTEREPYQVKGKLIRVLEEATDTVLTKSEVEAQIKANTGKSTNLNKYSEEISTWLVCSGWTFIKGRAGRGGTGKFVKG